MVSRPIKKILLIYPPVTYSVQSPKQSCPPLGVAYLAAAVRDIADVQILDAAVEGYEHEEKIGPTLMRYGLPISEIARRVEEYKPDAVGISCIFSSQFPAVAEISSAVKRIDPEILTMTGGTHPTFMPERSLDMSPDLDIIVRNEGERTLRNIVEASRQNDDWSSIRGIAYREDGEIKVNPPVEFISDLDDLPYPARDLLPMDKYFSLDLPMGIVSRQSPWINMVTSRGCPARCAFCSSSHFWGYCYRTRAPEAVLDEMEELVSRFGMREIKFFDDNLAAHLDRAKAIFQGMIERGIDVSWNTPNGIGIHNLDYEILDLMKRSGCYELTLAVESGDPYVLKNIIHKPFNLDKALEVSRILRRMKLGTYGFFIIGFPGETKEQILNTIKFARKLNLDRISVFVANPLPGTEVFNIAGERGYIGEDFPFEEADYFSARFDTPEWTGEWVEKTRKRFFWSYNLSLLVRDPIRFFRVYWPVMTHRPVSTVKLVLSRLFAG